MRTETDRIPWIAETALAVDFYSVTSIPPVFHEDVIEIIYCLQGECTITIAADEVKIGAGEFISIDCESYYIRKGSHCICASVYLDLNKMRDSFSEADDILFLCDGRKSAIQSRRKDLLHGRLLCLLLAYIEGKIDEEMATRISGQFLQFLIQNFDLLIDYGTENNMEVPEETLLRFRRINHYIKSHLEETIVMEDVSSLLGLTQGYVSELCRKYSVGFRNMISYFRINRAEKLILFTDKKLIDISEECGFSDSRYFYQAFRKWHLCSPHEYRKMYQNARLMDRQKNTVPPETMVPLLEQAVMDHYREMFALQR